MVVSRRTRLMVRWYAFFLKLIGHCYLVLANITDYYYLEVFRVGHTLVH